MTEYLLTKNLKKCCGCSACEQVCPKNAIALKPNEEGFLYPVLDEELCIKCGLCKSVCPYDNKNDLKEPEEVYAIQYKEQDILKKSSSGAAFSALADFVLAGGGAVAGCIFDETIRAVHIVTDKKELVEKMRGSKYVQSEMGDTFRSIKAILDDGRLVLFTGTPCQVGGLKNYLKKDYENLYTVDLICHGAPSPLLLKEYIKEIRETKGEIVSLRFRNKEQNGWCSQGSVTYNSKGKSKSFTITPFNNSYYNLYYMENCVSRYSCYSCPYATEKRVGDITIGDYWNIDERLSFNEYKEGMSVALINTEKGNKLLSEVKDNLRIYKSDLEHAVKGNGNLKAPNKMPEKRKDIYIKIKETGYDSAVKDYCKFSYFVPFLKKHMPKSLKQTLKKFL